MDQAYRWLINDIKIKYGDSVVVGVSGGPDSMALLHLMTRVKKVIDVEVICAHVNHNVRPESAEEAVFVEKFCKDNDIVFESMIIEDYGDDNFHNEARSIRYNYFSKLVKDYNAKYLLTAHHADDLIETILMRIVRGSTLRGYSGFSKIVPMEGYTILRPLIEMTKEDILEYNLKNNIEYRLDGSNVKDKYTRNRYRKYIVPEFKKEDPNVHTKFYKFSKTLLEYNAYVDKQVEQVIPKVYPQNILDVNEFLKLDKIIAMRVIYFALECVYQDDLMLITDQHADLIYDLIESKKANSQVFLPNNLIALKEYDTVTFIKHADKPKEYEIEMIEYVNLPNGKNIEVSPDCLTNGNDVCRLNSADIKFPLHIRTRQDGDKMSVKGMIGRKKINDIFIDEKIKVTDRDVWPVVVDSMGEIVWLPGLKKSKFDIELSEKCDIILRYY